MKHTRYFVESESQRAYFRPMARHRALDVEWEEYQAELRGQALRLSVRTLGDASVDCMLHHAGETALPVHVGAEWSVSFSDESYTLIPGVFYNGNASEEVKTHVVRWGREDLEPLGFALHAAASTLCLHREADGCTWMVEGAPQTPAGWSGWQVNRAAGTISYCAPAIERRRMRHWQWEDEPRAAYRLLPRGTLRFSFRVEGMRTTSIDDLFRLYFDRLWSRPAPGINYIELGEAGEMIVDHLQKRHWAKDKKRRPVFRNAVFDAEPMLGRDVPEWTRKWNVLMGWNSGPGVALPWLVECFQGLEILKLSVNPHPLASRATMEQHATISTPQTHSASMQGLTPHFMCYSVARPLPVSIGSRLLLADSSFHKISLNILMNHC